MVAEAEIETVEEVGIKMLKKYLLSYKMKLSMVWSNALLILSFCRTSGGIDGLLHVSKIADHRVEKVGDYLALEQKCASKY